MTMRKATIAIVVCAVLALALFGAMSGGGGVTPALAVAPTPASVSQPVRAQPALFTLFPTAVITQDTQGTCRELGNFSVADVQVVVDMSDTNTVTGYLQFSNDQVAFVDGVNVISTNVDLTAMQQTPLFGRYACWYSNVTTADPITVSVSAWVK
jgi:hypothetical protein